MIAGALFLACVVVVTLAVGRAMHRSDRIHCNRLTGRQRAELGKMVEELRKHAPRDDL